MKAAALLILLTITSSATLIKDDVIVWTETQKLTWADFQGAPHVGAFGDAGTAVSIKAKPYYEKRKLNYDVAAYFLRNKSWCKHKSNDLLAHEQLHFDIAEVYARLVRKKVKELERRGEKDLKVYNRAIQEILDESNATDLEYDQKTLHGLVQQEQKWWNEKVRIELELLRAYKSN